MPDATPDPDHDDRLQRLEEAAAFTDHTVEQLSAEIASLNQRLRDLTQRLEALEGRVTGVVEQLEKEDQQEEG